MPEDRPTISSSRLSANDVARHTFGQARRGFDPHEVRSFLELVSRELQSWEQREHDLRAELADAEERARNPVIEESTLSAALGQQSANLLRAAHEEAARIVTSAEEEAASLAHQAQRRASELTVAAETNSAERIAQAELSVAGIHQQSDRDAAAVAEAARTESEQILSRAREQGRALVERAQHARREVLADLAQRRRDLHLQIEQFRAARDELAAAVLGVRGSIDDIVSDLVQADDDARTAAAEVARRPAPDLEDLEEIDALVTAVEEASEAAASGDADEVEVEVVAEVEVPGDEVPGDEVPGDEVAGERAPDEATRDRQDAAAAGDEEPGDAGGKRQELVGQRQGGGDDSDEIAVAEARETKSVEDLFARIRAWRGQTGGDDEDQATADEAEGAPSGSEAEGAPSGSEAEGGTAGGGAEAEAVESGAGVTAAAAPAAAGAGGPGDRPGEEALDDSGAGGTVAGLEAVAVEAEDGDAESAPSEDEVLIRQRADLLDPVVARLVRRMKRALQDDQNRLLDKIRSGSGQLSVDALAREEDQSATFVDASSRMLKEAFVAGAVFAREHANPGSRSKPGRNADQLAGTTATAMAQELSTTVVSQLRRRLESDAGAGGALDDAAERVGVAYREWRGERIERLVGDIAVGAFSAGVLSATGPGSAVRWLPANGEAACPDCDDNSLAGSVKPGGEFPTGHAHPPAHAGCRCLVTPTTV